MESLLLAISTTEVWLEYSCILLVTHSLTLLILLMCCKIYALHKACACLCPQANWLLSESYYWQKDKSGQYFPWDWNYTVLNLPVLYTPNSNNKWKLKNLAIGKFLSFTQLVFSPPVTNIIIHIDLTLPVLALIVFHKTSIICQTALSETIPTFLLHPPCSFKVTT